MSVGNLVTFETGRLQMAHRLKIRRAPPRRTLDPDPPTAGPPPGDAPMSPKKSATKKTTARKTVVIKDRAKAPASPTPSTSKPAEMEAEVLEFIQAIDDYKRKAGRPFPSWSEVLEIIKGLGYERGA